VKTFDDDRRSWSVEDRTFVLGGETFVARAEIRPEVLADFEDETIRVPEEERSLKLVLAANDKAFLAMVEGGDDLSAGSARERYLALRQRIDEPLDLDRIAAATAWLFERHSGRPTVPSLPSGDGRGGTGTTSTGTSSPPEVEAQTLSLSAS
jgi:hypothetical protein